MEELIRITQKEDGSRVATRHNMIPIGTEITFMHTFCTADEYINLYGELQKDYSERGLIHLFIDGETILTIPISCLFKGIGKESKIIAKIIGETDHVHSNIYKLV